MRAVIRLTVASRSGALAFAVLLALLASVGSLRAQRTWVVDDTMAAGADYPDLQSACAAATRGDRIQIRLGSGNPYTLPAPFEKALTIVGLGATKPVLMMGNGSSGTLRCSPNEVMIFDNLEFRALNALALTMQIYDNRGLIVFSRVRSLGYMYATSRYPNRVVFAGSTIRHSFMSVYLSRTRMWLLDSETQTQSAVDSGLNGAITVDNLSTLWVVGGRHTGGDGLGDCWPLRPGFLGEPAIDARDGPLVIAGPATMLGGLQSTVNPVCGAGGGPWRVGPVSSHCLPGANATLIDPMVAGGPFPSTETCSLNQRHEMPALLPGPAARGQTQRIDAYGPQQSIVSVFASFLTPYEPITLPIGDVWLDPTLTVHVGSGGVDAQRRLVLTTTIPAWLAIGDALVYQAVSYSPSGAFEISAPGIAVVH
jgi:hypothetical protein